jgi:hypothetical protein
MVNDERRSAMRHRGRFSVMGIVVLLGASLGGLVGCSDDESDRGVVGPGVEVNCAAQSRTAPGVGDTDVRVQCPGAI